MIYTFIAVQMIAYALQIWLRTAQKINNKISFVYLITKYPM